MLIKVEDLVKLRSNYSGYFCLNLARRHLSNIFTYKWSIICNALITDKRCRNKLYYYCILLLLFYIIIILYYYYYIISLLYYVIIILLLYTIILYYYYIMLLMHYTIIKLYYCKKSRSCHNPSWTKLYWNMNPLL